VIIPLLIYVLVPVIGLVAFVWASRRVPVSELTSVVPMFSAAFCCGGLLLVVLTSFFWQWSGMASIGMFFLMLVGTPTMILQALWLTSRKDRGAYTLWAWRLSLGFPLAMASIFALAVGWSKVSGSF
jgi:hypothetical protein